MAKNREAVTCNGRTAFYACMWEDIRQCAMDCGWAVSLHGSLASDMDIMAMPWVENAISFKEMIDRISNLFKDNDMSSQYVITYNEKPHNRVVATIPIFSDFYLDISTINTTDVVPKSVVERLEIEIEALKIANGKMYSANKAQEAEVDRLEKALADKARECNMTIDKICLENRAEIALLNSSHEDELAAAKREAAWEIFAELDKMDIRIVRLRDAIKYIDLVKKYKYKNN